MALTVSTKSRCGSCISNQHDRCFIGTKYKGRLSHLKYPGGIVWACGCEDGGCKIGRRKCADCGNTNTDEVDPATWECFDREACTALVERRRENSPFTAQLREIREKVKVAKIQENEEKAARSTKPKTGTCVCGCAGETKGGKFLPGHDARFVSTLVGQVTEAKFTAKSEQTARKALKDAGASERLVGKFDKSLGLAREKAEKRAADAKAKADAKAEAASA